MDGRRKRRQYPIVNRTHQYRFLAYTLGYCFFIVSVFAVTIFIPDIIRMQDPTLSLELRAQAAKDVLTLHTTVWPVIIAVVCLIAIHSSRMFHRFIGPLFRFTQAFKEIANGKLAVRLTLREDDYLGLEKIELNRMIDSLVLHIREISDCTASLVEEAERLKAIGENTLLPARERENISRIARKARAVQDATGFFQLPEATPTDMKSAA